MTKRLIALLEILMAVSIVCTGYAAWVMAKAETLTIFGDSAGFGVYDTSQRYYTDYGVTIAKSGADGASYKGFSLRTTTGSGGTTYSFSNAMLSIVLVVDMDTLSTAHDGSYREESLVLTCRASSEYTGAQSFAAKNANGSDGIGAILTPPESAVLNVHGYPSFTRDVPVTLNADGELEIEVPLQMLYDLLSACEQATTPSVVVDIPFTFAPIEGVDVATNANNVILYKYEFFGALRAYR